VTYYGHNSLYRNLGGGKFQDITERRRAAGDGTRWGSGCAFIDYDRDGLLDIFVANYVDFDLANVPKPGSSKTVSGRDWRCGAGRTVFRPRTMRSITITETEPSPTFPPRPAS